MIFVDSSVWIDFFHGRATAHVDRLVRGLATDEVVTGDLVVFEVLQGFRDDNEFTRAHAALLSLNPICVADVDVAVRAARNFRALRRAGITVRKTIDSLIAARCIVDGYALLYTDHDFDPYAER